MVEEVPGAAVVTGAAIVVEAEGASAVEWVTFPEQATIARRAATNHLLMPNRRCSPPISSQPLLDLSPGAGTPLIWSRKRTDHQISSETDPYPIPHQIGTYWAVVGRSGLPVCECREPANQIQSA